MLAVPTRSNGTWAGVLGVCLAVLALDGEASSSRRPGGVAPAQGYPSPADWRDENIYFLFLDRFNDGDPSNNNANPEQSYDPEHRHGIHGGDLKGIRDKLDYIAALGATAIWITPIPENAGWSSYHGYGAHDLTRVAPHWGTFSDLTGMVAAAHSRGIRVVLDIVVNHMGDRLHAGSGGWQPYKAGGYKLRWNDDAKRYPAPFDSADYFHNFGHIQSYTDPEQILGDVSGLDDLKTESRYVRRNLAKIYSDWITRADLDGYRLDTVKHVEIGFWQFFNPAIRAHAAAFGKTNFFQFGEVLDGGDDKCGFYTGTQAGGAFANDSVLDYPLYFRLNSVFARADGDTKQIVDRYDAIPGRYAPSAEMSLVTFLDNHDQPRFLSEHHAHDKMERLDLALGFLYSSRGIPCLYYGTEQAFNGGHDPENREDMFDGLFEKGPSVGDNFNMTHPLFLRVAELNNFRRLYPSLRRGAHVNLWSDSQGPGLFAYARRLGDEEVFVVLNTATEARTLTNRPTSYAAGTRLVNLLDTNESVTVTAATNLPPLSIPGMSFKMFVADALRRAPDPVVISQDPSHGATNVAADAPLILRFNRAMDTGSAEVALVLDPPRSGRIVWNGARDELTFSPDMPGWGATTRVAVSLGTGAVDAVHGKGMHAPFATFFVTAPPL